VVLSRFFLLAFFLFCEHGAVSSRFMGGEDCLTIEHIKQSLFLSLFARNHVILNYKLFLNIVFSIFVLSFLVVFSFLGSCGPRAFGCFGAVQGGIDCLLSMIVKQSISRKERLISC
jgi:hypothetical protein